MIDVQLANLEQLFNEALHRVFPGTKVVVVTGGVEVTMTHRALTNVAVIAVEKYVDRFRDAVQI